MSQEVTSPQNQYVKQMRSLYTRKGREKTGLIPVEGSRFVAEALAAAEQGVTTIESLFYESSFYESDALSRELVDNVSQVAGKVFQCPASILNNLTSTETPQGIVAAVRRPRLSYRPASPRALYLVVDRVQDPGNLGTMIRTAAAVQVDEVLCLKGTVDPFNPKALRATMGAIFRVPIRFCANPSELIGKLQGWGCRLVAADLAGDRLHYHADYTGRVAVIVGNEGQGIDPNLLAAADVKVRIPLADDVESLNAAVACGILLYEAVRFRHLGASCNQSQRVSPDSGMGLES
ncbi:MAG: RNA methyltransferase [Firmicutes bacterium]|nr:RNA methyltransferase [Bacillota bacterium]